MLLLWILVWGLLLDKSIQLQTKRQQRKAMVVSNGIDSTSEKMAQRNTEEEIQAEHLKMTIIPTSSAASGSIEKVPVIRVLLMTTGYKSYEHQEVSGICGGEAFTYSADSPEFQKAESIEIGSENEKTTVTSIERQCGNPLYSGKLKICRQGDSLVVINEVPLEDYLESVVPSEMPSSYEAEALKAQAVCARTYAWKHMLGNGIKGYDADVDDSVNYQVYGNIEVQEKTSIAVQETKGEILKQNGEPVEAYYFSTSSGATSTDEVWGVSEAASYLKSVECPFDMNMPWSEWKVTLPWNTIEKRVQEKTGNQSALLSVEIRRKTQSGGALELFILMEDTEDIVEGEYEIREFLSPRGCEITEKDGSTVTGGTLLPSAYFSMEMIPKKEIRIEGRGYGHGVGMSQNAANEMAKEGYTYREILDYFFKDITIGTCS